MGEIDPTQPVGGELCSNCGGCSRLKTVVELMIDYTSRVDSRARVYMDCPVRDALALRELVVEVAADNRTGAIAAALSHTESANMHPDDPNRLLAYVGAKHVG